MNDTQDTWAAGYGAIRHTPLTRRRVQAMAEALSGDVWTVLHAADRVASAAMWLVVHETYARAVYLDGRALKREDFKAKPEGHTGGSLNMVPAYTGYMAANALAGITRGWLMGQGHCVSAVDSVNLLLGNMTEAHAARYDVSDAGLTRYVRDFYAYRIGADGRQESPLDGEHVHEGGVDVVDALSQVRELGVRFLSHSPNLPTPAYYRARRRGAMSRSNCSRNRGWL